MKTFDRFHFTLFVFLIGSGAACNRLPPTAPPAATNPGFQRGMNIACWTGRCFREGPLGPTMQRLQALGVNWISVVFTAFQNTAEDDYIDMPTESELEAEIAAVVRRARAMGLHLMLKPHIDVRDGTWRGKIDPEDVQRWFENYSHFILSVARIAERHSIPQFVGGTELVKLSRHDARWRDLITRVRRVYSGRLLYAASWNEFEAVKFWDALDLAGIDAYFPLTAQKDPALIDLLAGWQEWLGRLEVWHRHVNKPVIFTEIGYTSRDGTNMHPYRFDLRSPLDMAEQADCYRAAFHAFREIPFLKGAFWWYWRVDSGGGAGNGDYPPTGKVAEEVLRSAWGEPAL